MGKELILPDQKIENPVIHNFYAGWLTFELGNYRCGASYMSPTPEDLLDACIKKLNVPWETPCVRLDEEDKGETFVVFDNYIFIVKNKRVFCRDNYYSVKDFAQSLVKTIETNLDNIVDDFYCIEKLFPGGVQRKKRSLNRRIKTIKNLLERRK